MDSDSDAVMDTYVPTGIIEIEVGLSRNYIGDYIAGSDYITSGYIALTLQTGSGPAVVRRAEHGWNGPSTVGFEYQVTEDDMDEDGVSIAANAIRFETASGVELFLLHEAVPSQPNHRVDGSLADTVPPEYDGWGGICNNPVDGNTFRRDEVIWVCARFTEAVIVNTAGGAPTLEIEIGSNNRQAVYDSGSNDGRELFFIYTVAADDYDLDGVVWVPAGSLSIPLGSSITDEAGNNVDISSWIGLSAGSPVRVNGTDSEPEPFFADANLEGAVRQALGRPGGALTPADLASLTRLEASSANIQNLAGLEHATALTFLDLSRNQDISDVSPLASLTNLDTLRLDHASITDVSPLVSLTNLESLDLEGTDITDAGVGSLASLTNLLFLDLGQTGITDTGVASLASLTSLTDLDLSGTSITDTGVASLASLTSLTSLRLGATSITDVSPLLSLTNLEHLNLSDITTLNEASLLTHIPALEAAGVTVVR